MRESSTSQTYATVNTEGSVEPLGFLDAHRLAQARGGAQTLARVRGFTSACRGYSRDDALFSRIKLPATDSGDEGESEDVAPAFPDLIRRPAQPASGE